MNNNKIEYNTKIIIVQGNLNVTLKAEKRQKEVNLEICPLCSDFKYDIDFLIEA